jgi:hypothetical protein
MPNTKNSILNAKVSLATNRVKIKSTSFWLAEQLIPTIIEALHDVEVWCPEEEGGSYEIDYPQIAQSLCQADSSHSLAVLYKEQLIGMCILQRSENENVLTLSFWCVKGPNTIDLLIEAILAVMKFASEKYSIEKFVLPILLGNYVQENIAKHLHFKLKNIEIHGTKQIKAYISTSQTPISQANYQVNID